MSVAKIIEVNAASKTSMEDAVKVGLKKTSETVKNIKGAWVNGSRSSPTTAATSPNGASTCASASW